MLNYQRVYGFIDVFFVLTNHIQPPTTTILSCLIINHWVTELQRLSFLAAPPNLAPLSQSRPHVHLEILFIPYSTKMFL